MSNIKCGIRVVASDLLEFLFFLLVLKESVLEFFERRVVLVVSCRPREKLTGKGLASGLHFEC